MICLQKKFCFQVHFTNCDGINVDQADSSPTVSSFRIGTIILFILSRMYY